MVIMWFTLSSLVVSLVTMFRDASLNTDEMDLVLEKICNTLKKMAPNEVPPLIYQVTFKMLKAAILFSFCLFLTDLHYKGVSIIKSLLT